MIRTQAGAPLRIPVNALVNAPCVCQDDGADTLRQMIADGMGQWEASRRLWGPEAPLVDAEATRAWVRAEFMRRFPWLRLDAS